VIPTKTSLRVNKVAIALLVPLAVTLAISGYALAALTIGSTSESSEGGYSSATGLSYWYQVQLFATSIPTPDPTAVSPTASVPTVLASASTSYVINSATAGDPAIALRFQETRSGGGVAPPSTEIELRFTLSIGGMSGTTSARDFVETQPTISGGAIEFTFYYDTGSVTISQTTITSVVDSSQVCTSVGACP